MPVGKLLLLIVFILVIWYGFKYVNRVEAVDSLTHIARGKGGFWEDRGYQWYAGQ